MNSKQCPTCGSTNLYQESATIYRCGDCFDKLPTGGMVDLPPPKVYGTSKQNNKTGNLGNWKNLVTGIVFAWIVLGSTAISYFQNTQSGSNSLQEEKTTTIPIDPPLESNEIIPEGEFQFISAIPDVIGNVYFVGKFTNKSSQNLLMPKFTVDLLNQDGVSLGTSFGYAEKNIVIAGESVIFQVLHEKVPKYSDYNINVSAMTISEISDQPTLVLKNIDFKRNQYKEIVLAGKIQNKGNTTTNHTRITCLLLDKQENTVDYESISLDKENFLPKESQNFEIVFSRSKQKPDSYFCETNAVLKENTNH
ncbi:hypothetical protein [Leptospira perdikensis]|uniref:DUF3426 domain-containing protein n=1 Tax=Leptospira perdikensis TaxID=2484948 RepID=A0A4R9JFL6_9LEPT|nr:hypothetical protein [Leptospira perdikensis]TGL40314.1 hypothetical protein EHQ49_09645 [Leptospira perdikensis]